jgi:hypothetical protein
MLSQRWRKVVLTAHIMMSVGLLGDAAGFLAVAIRAARTVNADTVVELLKVLNMFSMVFGIPLSFGALLSGLTLGLGTKGRLSLSVGDACGMRKEQICTRRFYRWRVL